MDHFSWNKMKINLVHVSGTSKAILRFVKNQISEKGPILYNMRIIFQWKFSWINMKINLVHVSGTSKTDFAIRKKINSPFLTSKSAVKHRLNSRNMKNIWPKLNNFETTTLGFRIIDVNFNFAKRSMISIYLDNDIYLAYLHYF